MCPEGILGHSSCQPRSQLCNFTRDVVWLPGRFTQTGSFCAEPSVLVAHLVTWRTLSNGSPQGSDYLSPAVSGIIWQGVVLCKIWAVCFCCSTWTLQFVDSLRVTPHSPHIPPCIQHVWGGNCWEKGQELCWEQSGVVMDQSDSAYPRIMLQSWCNNSLWVRWCLGGHRDLSKECGEVLWPKEDTPSEILWTLAADSVLIPVWCNYFISWGTSHKVYFFHSSKLFIGKSIKHFKSAVVVTIMEKILAFICW